MFAILTIFTELTMKGTSPAELFQSNQGSRAPWFLFWLLVGIAVLAVIVAWWMSRGEEDESPVAPSAVSGDTPTPEPVTAQAAAPASAEEAAEEPAEEESPEAETVAEEDDVAEEVAEPTEPETSVEPDDLTKMEGIGPKISGILQEKGIKTYSQLANTSVEELKQILTDAKIKIAHPDTWPEQAALAAAGNWDALEKLQDELHGGRRKG